MSFRTDARSAGATEQTQLRADQALMLGALHGPAELLPISSSGHVALIPWLLGWDYDRLDPDLRKSFEVVLHAGTAAALLITLRSEVRDAVGAMNRRLAALIALSFAPPAIIGYKLERLIEELLRHPADDRRGTDLRLAGDGLGRPGTAAAKLSGGRAPETRCTSASPRRARWSPECRATAPTLAAARLREFTREDANRLSRHVALPVDRRGDGAQGRAAGSAGHSAQHPAPVLRWAPGHRSSPLWAQRG